MQRLLILHTNDSDIRYGEVNFSKLEDPEHTKVILQRQYKTVIQAMGDGWNILSKPEEKYYESNFVGRYYEWWLVKEV